jgi:hypothetical protein
MSVGSYLQELKNNGLLDEMNSKLDRRRKIYYPIVDIWQFQKHYSHGRRIDNYTNVCENDNNLQFARLTLSNNYNKIIGNWLNLEILDLLKYGIGKTNMFRLLDKDHNQLCLCQFVKEYNKLGSLIRYF